MNPQYNSTAAEEKSSEAAGQYPPSQPPAYDQAATGQYTDGYPAGYSAYPPPGSNTGYSAGTAAPGAQPMGYGVQQQPPAGYYPNTQQPMGYGVPQAGAQTTYVYVQPAPLSNPPEDHFGYSIFVTVCCCWLIGLFAIAKSMECRTAIRTGNRPLAEVKSQETRKLAHIALGVGIVCIILVVILSVLRVVLLRY